MPDTATVTDGATQAGDRGRPGVRLRAVTKSFGQVAAVRGVDLEIGDGEFFSMLGPSGSGKTTVLRMIAGFEHPTSGTIELDGRDVTRLAPFARDVNTVFQDYALFPHMSVEQNVAYGLSVTGVPKIERRQRAQEALATVRLEGYGDRRPHQLSGGQRQRVALARALVNRPRVLLLDEPLGALDLKLRQEMQVELKTLQREVGITFLFVTHDQEEALTMSDRIAVFNQGLLEQVGTPQEVYESPATPFVAGFVGTSNVLDGAAAQQLLGETGTWVVRPERVRISASGTTPAPSAGTVVASGVLRDTVYAGPVLRHVVDLDAGVPVTAVSSVAESPDLPDTPGTAGSAGTLARGARVSVSFTRSSARRLP